MPSYPTSPHTFTPFSNGALSDAAQVTAIYSEVEAMEAGLLNGTARINSSGSTMTSLSVTGGSTFASRPVMPPPAAARVQLEAAAEIAAASTTPLAWTAQAFVTNSSMHSTATNPHRLTPQTTGLYMCQAMIEWQTAASTDYDVHVMDSSGAFIARVRYIGSSGQKIQYVAGLKRFDAVGDTQWARVVIRSIGSTNSVSTDAFFSMHKL